MELIQNDLSSIEVTASSFALSLYLPCFIGAFLLYFKLITDGRSPIPILGYFDQKWLHTKFGKAVDIFIFSALGAFIGITVTNPSSPAQAIAAGLGWTGIIGVSKASQEELSPAEKNANVAEEIVGIVERKAQVNEVV